MADSLPSIRFSNVGNKLRRKPRPPVASLSLPAISTRGLTVIASTGHTCSKDTTQSGKPSKGVRKRLGRVPKWWEVIPEYHGMGKKSRPQFVPEPLAVQVFRKTEKMDGPRLLPPLAAASENTPKVPAAHELQLLQTFAWPAQDYPSYLSVTSCGNFKEVTSRRPQRREAHVTTVTGVTLSPPHVSFPPQAPFPLVSLPPISCRLKRTWLNANVAPKHLERSNANTTGLPVILIDGSRIDDSKRPRSYSTVALPQLTATSVAERFKQRRASDSVCVTRRRRAGGLAPLHTVDVGAFFGSLPLWLQRVRDALDCGAGTGMADSAGTAVRYADDVRKLMAVMRGTLSCGDRALSVEEQSDMRTVQEILTTLASKLTIIDLNAQFMNTIATARSFQTDRLPRRPRGRVRIVDGSASGDSVMGIVGSDCGYRLKHPPATIDDSDPHDTDNMKKDSTGGDGGKCDIGGGGGDGIAGIDGGGNGGKSEQAGNPLAHPLQLVPSPLPPCTLSGSIASTTSTSHTSTNHTSTNHTSTNHTSTNHTSTNHTSTSHTSPSHLLNEYKMSALDDRLRKKGLKVYTKEESKSILESVQRDLTKLKTNDAVSSTAEMETKKTVSDHSVTKEMKRRRSLGKVKALKTPALQQPDQMGDEDEGSVGVEGEGTQRDTKDDTPDRSTPEVPMTDAVASNSPTLTNDDTKSESPIATDTAPASPERTARAQVVLPSGAHPLVAPTRRTAAMSRTSTSRHQNSRSKMTRTSSQSTPLARRQTSTTTFLPDPKGRVLKRQRHVLTPPESPVSEVKTDLLKEISDVKAMVRGVRETVGGDVASHETSQLPPPNSSSMDPKQSTLQEVQGEEADQTSMQKQRRKAIEKELEKDLEHEREEVIKRRQQCAQERERAKMAEREAKRKLSLQKAQEELHAAAERERRNAILQRLRNELELKHTLQTYIAETLASYDRDVQTWEEADYAYIDYCLGAQRCGEVKRLEEERRMEEKRSLEDHLNRALEYRKQELLLRLQEAQQQFYDSVQREKAALEKVLKLSPAFIFSYFDASAQPRVQLESEE